MLTSMTGFGEARRQTAAVSALVEIRTINSRHFKLHFRASEGYASLEPNVESVVRETVRRGTVHVNLRVDRQASPDDYRINESVVENYRAQMTALAGRNGWPDTVSLESLLLLPGAVDEKQRTSIDPHEDWPDIEPVLRDALAAVTKMRSDEGAAMRTDLVQNGTFIEGHLSDIARRAPAVAEAYQARLVQRVNQALSELNVTVEPAELLREISLFADKSDISEEIVRLRSHLQQFVEALELSESSGRKLEFIAQEMGREVNTIGSKANDAELSRFVVEIKSALERIREQIQNVE